jgi:hypothetical protein
MRRGVGVGAVRRADDGKQGFEQLARELAEMKMAHVQTQLEVFKKRLEEFATRHKREINEDPAFRREVGV